MAEIGFVGKVLCAGVAFTAVAIESACHSTFGIKRSLDSLKFATAADYDTQNVALSAIRVEHNKTLLEVHLGYQAKMAAQTITHRAEMQQLQDQVHLAKQSLGHEDAQALLEVYDPVPKQRPAVTPDAAFSPASLQTMLNSAYRQIDQLSQQSHEQKQAAEELLHEAFKAGGVVTAQKQEIAFLSQEVQSLQQQLACFKPATQHAEQQPAASTPLAQVIRNSQNAGWLPKDFSLQDLMPAMECSYAAPPSASDDSCSATLSPRDGVSPRCAETEHDLGDASSANGSSSSSSWKLFTPLALPRSTLTPRSSSGSDSVFENPIFVPGQSSEGC